MFAINLIEVFVLQEIKSGNQQQGLWTSLARSPRVPPCPVHAWEMTLAICGAKNKQFDSGGILLMQRESSAKRPLLSLDAIWRHPNVRPPSVCSLKHACGLCFRGLHEQGSLLAVLRKADETNEIEEQKSFNSRPTKNR